MNLNLFYSELESHVIFKQLLGREGMNELIVSIDSGRNVIDDHNWNRKKVRFCVQKIGDVSVLYYRQWRNCGRAGGHCPPILQCLLPPSLENDIFHEANSNDNKILLPPHLGSVASPKFKVCYATDYREIASGPHV